MYPGALPKQAHLSWLPVYPGESPPPHAVDAGNRVYVIRCRHEEDVIPGKWPYDLGGIAHIPYNGKEIEVNSFEVLCNTSLFPNHKGYQWISCSGGQVPPAALHAGMAGGPSGQPLYVARGEVNGEMCVGQVQLMNNCACVPWGGEEHRLSTYEVLCVQD
ncbi:Natterin-4 [Paragonimus heterotremus]|uniref:Natterin-4 n=1 Tax=Paragonimus heterotremus TaxID=100268 RepID=A0A8J4SWP4_9TREM|nr:Natterin-4 [Paragonimus heterotremus]